MQRNTPSLHGWACGFSVLLSICLTFVSLPALGQHSSVAASAAQPGDAGLFDTWAGYSCGRYPVAATAADFNGDGAPDVAWARHDWFHGQIPGNSMTVQLNLGEGTLGAPTDWLSVDMSNDIGSADLDGDGDADVVVISEGNTLTNATIDIYRSNGDGTFTASTAAGGEGPQRLALADFDGDGDIDLAMTNGWGSLVVSVGNGRVTSTPAGINCGATCSYFYVAGTLVTLTATPASNSTFTGWSGACTGTAAKCQVPMTAAKSVTAGFTK